MEVGWDVEKRTTLKISNKGVKNMGFNDEFDAVNKRTSSPGKVIGSPGQEIKRLKTNKKRLAIFLRYYSQTGNYGMSCRRAGIHVRIPKQLAKLSYVRRSLG